MIPPNPFSDPTGFETLEAFSRAKAFNDWVYQKIKRWIKGRVLEIGSGIGNISTIILQEHRSVSLSDLRPEYCHLLEKKFQNNPHLEEVLQLDLAMPDFQMRYAAWLGKFESVIALNVVEHIADDVQAIRNARSLLCDNGNLIVLVPAWQILYNRLDKELGHYKRYSRRGLTNLMQTAGLQTVGTVYFNAAAIPGWWFSGTLLGKKDIDHTLLRLYNVLVPFFKLLDRLLSPITGISVICVGVKN